MKTHFDDRKNFLFGQTPSTRWLILSALTVILVILLNLLVSLLPARWSKFDMTAQKLTVLSDVTRDYVKTLEEEVTLHFICVTGNEDESVRTLLERYGELSGKLQVESVDPAVRPSFIPSYTDRTLSDNSIIVESAKRSKVLDYTDLLIYTVYYTEDGSDYSLVGEMLHDDFTTFYETYADYFSYGYYAYDARFAGESAITSAIDYVTGNVLPKIYVLTGHGETELPSSLISYLSLDNIDCEAFALPTADALPDDADCLVLNAPQTDLTEQETALLRDYLAASGNLILLTDNESLKLTVLMELIKEFGMEAASGLLKETKSMNYYSYPYFLLPNTESARQLYGLTGYSLIMPYSHPISMTDSDYTLTYTSLFRTSASAILEKYESEETEDGTDTSSELPAQYDVGALVTLSSSRGNGHICWLGSPMLLESDYNSAVSGGNYTYFIAILESMCEKTNSLAIDSKAMTEDSLVLSTGQVSFWAIVIIGLIPLACLIIGIVIRERRRLR